MGQPLADCDFNLAALHPAYPIKRRTSAERTQASPERRHPEEFPPLPIRERYPPGADIRRASYEGIWPDRSAHHGLRGSERPATRKIERGTEFDPHTMDDERRADVNDFWATPCTLERIRLSPGFGPRAIEFAPCKICGTMTLTSVTSCAIK